MFKVFLIFYLFSFCLCMCCVLVFFLFIYLFICYCTHLLFSVDRSPTHKCHLFLICLQSSTCSLLQWQLLLFYVVETFFFLFLINIFRLESFFKQQISLPVCLCIFCVSRQEQPRILFTKHKSKMESFQGEGPRFFHAKQYFT